MINFVGSWEDYLATRKSKWRNNYRRWQRQSGKLGELTHVRFRPEAGENTDPRWDYYDECLRIASTSWQGSSLTGTTLTHDKVAPFLREAHLTAVRRGCADLNLLCLNGRAVAFAYNYVFDGHVFGLRIGYDPTIKCKGAGNLLYTMLIEDSFRRGDWRYDLGPRHIDCKRGLLTDVMPIYRLSCGDTWSVRQQLLIWKRRWDALRFETAASG